MRFMVGDVEVFFPYKYIYREQYEYMVELKARGRGVGGTHRGSFVTCLCGSWLRRTECS